MATKLVFNSFKSVNIYSFIKYKRCLATNQKVNSSAQYCLDQVKKYDHENFLCTLLLKGEFRRHAFAIRAFNVEVSRIFSVVTDDKIGLMRLKFWDNAIENLFDKTEKSVIPDHPVVNELKFAIDNGKLSKRYFKKLIEYRSQFLNRIFISSKELEEYSENTNSNIFYLLYETHDIKNVHADHAASHLGKAQGIINLLRSIPYLDRTKQIPIPQETLLKYGVSQERILRNKDTDKGVQDCVFEIAGLAYQHLEKSKKLVKTSVPSNCKIILLPTVAIERYLEKLRKCNFHLTNSNLLKRDSTLPLAYYFAKIFKY